MSLWGSIKKKAKKVWKKVKNTVKKAAKIVKDISIRFLGVFGFIGSLLGIRPRKHLRLKIYILSKNGSPVQKEAHVKTWLDKAIDIFDEKLNVEIRKPNLYLEFISIIKENAPDPALNPPNHGFGNYFSDAADYFEDHLNYEITGTGSFLADWFGYGEPIYAFVVDQIQNDKSGTVYWWGSNYCVLSSDASLTTLAHEIGHVCGLSHWNSARNLMNQKRDKNKDYDLNRLQISWARNSRFIIFVPRRG